MTMRGNSQNVDCDLDPTNMGFDCSSNAIVHDKMLIEFTGVDKPICAFFLFIEGYIDPTIGSQLDSTYVYTRGNFPLLIGKPTVTSNYGATTCTVTDSNPAAHAWWTS